MSIYVNNLSICVTNMCDLRCAHCLRGEERRKDFDIGLLDNLFEGLNGIGDVCITGGEPRLNTVGVSVISRRILDEMKKKGPGYCTGMFIVTNGLTYEHALVDAVRAIRDEYMRHSYRGYKVAHNGRLSDKVLSRGQVDSFCEEELSHFGIACSLDPFHVPIPMESYIQYRNSGVYSNVKEWADGSSKVLIDRGRAGSDLRGSSYKLASRDVRGMSLIEGVDADVCVEEVYVTVDGKVYGDCDMSYEQESSGEAYGNLHDETLYSILDRLATEEGFYERLK